MPIVLLLKYWKLGLASIAVVLLVIVLSANASLRQTIKQLNTEHELALVKMKSDYASKAREIERTNYAQVIQAVNDAKKREQVLLANIASANDTVASMSNTVAEVSAAAKLNAELGDRYIDTSRRIITECTSEYSKMGAIAQGLSNDLRLSQEASRRKQ